MTLLLLIPVTQAALDIVNSAGQPSAYAARASQPGLRGRDSGYRARRMVVVPTLLISAENAARLLEDLEIRYLANRDPNLCFALAD